MNARRRIPVAPATARCEPLEARRLLAFSFQFDFRFDSAGFFEVAERREALESAAGLVANRIGDSLAAIVPGGQNAWSTAFNDPATGSQRSLSNLVVPLDAVIVFVGARDLGEETLGVGGPAGFSAQGSSAFVRNVQSRGKAGAVGDASAQTAFAPAAGAISFDIDADWFFGPASSSVPAGQRDFFSVVQHELAHVLGFGTSAAWTNVTSSGAFAGPAASAAFGGAVPLDAEGAHWRQDVRSDGRAAAMVAAAPPGARFALTSLDFAALQDLGWDVLASPPRMELFGAGGAAIADAAPAAASIGSDFGKLRPGAAAQRTFVIRNSGGRDLTIGDIAVAGAFALAQPPASIVAPGGETSFIIAAVTSGEGAFAGRVSIAGDDPLVDGAFAFDLASRVVAAPSLQFAAPLVYASESAGALRFTVSRSGDPDLTASAVLSIAGTNAALGVDFGLPASLTVSLGPAQAQRTIDLPLIDNAFSDGDRRVLVTLVNPTGETLLGPQAATTLTLVDDEPDDASDYVAALYPALLGRAADAGGREFHAGAVRAARSAGLPAILEQILASAERQVRVVGGPSGVWPTLLRRAPSDAERATAAARLEGGTRVEDLQADVAASQEYFALQGGKNVNFIRAAFRDLLGRAARDDEVAHFNNNVLAAGGTRRDVAAALVFGGDYRRAFVRGLFLTHLRRPASSGDLSFWLGQFASGARQEQIERDIAGTDEALRLAGNRIDAWLRSAYLRLLGREPDAAGRTFFLEVARQAEPFAAARRGAALAIQASDEHRTRFVRQAYLDLLEREADPGGLAFWVGRLRAGASARDVQAELLGSGEAFALAGASPEAWVRRLFRTLLGREPAPAGLQFYVQRHQAGAALPALAREVLATGEFVARRAAAVAPGLLGQDPTSDMLAAWTEASVAQAWDDPRLLAEIAAARSL